MNRLEELRKKNSVVIKSVNDPAFLPYGRVIEGYDFSDLMRCMEKNTPIPAEGNIYVASVPEMEALPSAAVIKKVVFGDMPIQIGYCNGRNTTLNGFEYHKAAEINIAVTDLMLFLGHSWDIGPDLTYPLSEAEKTARDAAFAAGDFEARLLLQRGKWVIAHPEREPLIRQGACPGVTGSNTELVY